MLLRTIEIERPERNKSVTSPTALTSATTGSSGSGSGGGMLGLAASLAVTAQSSLSTSASSVGSSHHHHHHGHHHGHQQQRHLIDVYFIITGVHGSTKKIYMNNYEIKRLNEHDDPKEKYFEFKSEDVGKLLKINVSINQDDDPATYLYIDFIEIKIPSKSEAYKYFISLFVYSFRLLSAEWSV